MAAEKRYDHVAVAVRSIKDAVPLFQDILGGVYLKGQDEPNDGYRWLQFEYQGGAHIELLEPLGDRGFLHDFLAQRGEGVHHITFKVSDLREVVATLRAQGYQVVKENFGDTAWMEAFVHPRSAHGVLIQLVQTSLSEEEHIRRSSLALEDVLK